MSKFKTAVFLSGSGGKISQEVAIIDQLVRQKKISINEKDTFLAGFGSGALNLVALNACFRSDNPTSWDHYFKGIFLHTINDDEIFIKTDPIHWCTHPQRKRIELLLKIFGFEKMGDLPFNSAILTTPQYSKKTKWVRSDSHKVENIDLADILMATTAIPVLFPAHQLNSVDERPISISDGAYAEGSINGIFKKFKKQLKKIVSENGPFEELFIISPQRDNNDFVTKKHNLNAMIANEKVIFNNYIDQISMNGFLEFLSDIEKANSKKKIAKTIYVCIPEMNYDFHFLDFSNQVNRYKIVYDWFENNLDRLAVDLVQFNQDVSITALHA